MRLLLIALILFLVVTFPFLVIAEKGNKGEPDINDLADGVKQAAAVSGHPEVSAAIEVIQALKTESSSSISERYDQFGFTSINNVMDHSTGNVWANKLDELVTLWLSDDGFNSIPAIHKNILSKALAEYAILIQDEKYQKQKYDMSFNDGVGHIFMMVLILEPHPTKPNAIAWEKLLLQSDFKPAPSYVIVTESDCNILSCDRTDTIVYMPLTVSDAHFNSLLNLNLHMLDTYNRKMISG